MRGCQLCVLHLQGAVVVGELGQICLGVVEEGGGVLRLGGQLGVLGLEEQQAGERDGKKLPRVDWCGIPVKISSGCARDKNDKHGARAKQKAVAKSAVAKQKSPGGE